MQLGLAVLPLRFYNIMITMLTAFGLSVVSIKIVGALLVSSLLTIPVACSLLISRSFKYSVFWSVIFAELAVLIGLVSAGVWDLAPGATVVLALIVLLIGILFVKRGLRL